IYGTRVSLLVGATVAITSLLIGTTLGLVIGFYRRLDAIMMRVMDGLMAIPAILLALALMALMKASVRNVIIALVIPEIPRVIRVVRASVLSLREHTMVEGARALGARTPRILRWYLLPALFAPLPTVVARLRRTPPCLPPEQDCAGEAGARTGKASTRVFTHDRPRTGHSRGCGLPPPRWAASRGRKGAAIVESRGV